MAYKHSNALKLRSNTRVRKLSLVCLCDALRCTSVIQNICKQAQQTSPTVSCATAERLKMIANTVKEAHASRHARHMLVDDLTIC
jgi:hypothetical protein